MFWISVKLIVLALVVCIDNHYQSNVVCGLQKQDTSFVSSKIPQSVF